MTKKSYAFALIGAALGVMLGVVLRYLFGLFALLCACNAGAQQIVSVDPGEVWLNASDGYQEQVTWRVASRGGAVSPRGVFVNLDNNRELAVVDRVLEFSGDRGATTEVVRVSATQAHSWYAKGVRRLGYRRAFTGPAGSLANHILFDLGASGRLTRVAASPAQQTVSSQSREMMLAWDLDSDLGDIAAYSAGGQFVAGDRVVYEVAQPLTAQAGETLNEIIALPPGLVSSLMANGIYQLRYTRTFVDDKDTRRSASVDIRLTQ